MRVLIVGGGTAGLTLSLCLSRRGHDVTLVERSARLRDEGTMLDFFGTGYDAAERLELVDALESIHYPIPTLSFLRSDGRTRTQISYERMRAGIFDDRHFNFLRGDLERVLYGLLVDTSTVRFGVSIESYRDRGDCIIAHLTDGSTQKFDLLVGADGVNSRVRSLAFGEEGRFLRRLGYHAAAYAIADQELAGLVGPRFTTLNLAGRQASIYPIREGRVATFWVHCAPSPILNESRSAALGELCELYGGMGWIVPRLLQRAQDAATVYFDDVCQVEMPRWSRGRVVLVGDACACVSPLAGQGASIAMGAAWVLAEALENSRGDLPSALARYEDQLRPAVLRKQRAARGMARWFVPESRLRLALRDAVLRLSSSPLFAWLVKRQVAGESMLAPLPAPAGRAPSRPQGTFRSPK